MRDLFRRASDLFWQHPILWLPVAVADLASFGLTQLQKWLTHAIITHMVTVHSVLTNAPEPADIGKLTMKVVLLTRPIVWGNYLLSLCLYTFAMIAISTTLPQLAAEEKFSPSSTLGAIRRSGSRVLIFAFKLLVLIGIAAIPLAASGVLFTRYIRLIPNFYFYYGVVVSLMAALAYFVAPWAVTLLRSRTAERISNEVAQRARIFAALTQPASAAIYLFAAAVRRSLLSATTPISAIYTLDVVESLASAAPYILLFIALSLLASDEPSATTPPGAESDEIGNTGFGSSMAE